LDLGLIAVCMAYYFGRLQSGAVLIILASSVLGDRQLQRVAWFGIRINTVGEVLLLSAWRGIAATLAILSAPA
jgi:hypothetical protein